MMADRTFLGSIGRVDEDQRHASYGSLVGYKLSELVEAPRMMITSLRLLNRCSLSNPLKILKGDQRKGVFSLRDQSLGDAMVSISSKPCHSARQLLEMSLSRFGPNALEFGLESIRFSRDILDFLDHNTKVENAFDEDQISLTPNPISPGLLVFSKSDRISGAEVTI
jgi:hypothetical protein